MQMNIVYKGFIIIQPEEGCVVGKPYIVSQGVKFYFNSVRAAKQSVGRALNSPVIP